jgi:SAM-dependent methyltransferase
VGSKNGSDQALRRFYKTKEAFDVMHLGDFGDRVPYFELVAKTLVHEFSPRSALDVGCGAGELVNELRKAEVEAYGVDISEYAIIRGIEDVRGYLATADLDSERLPFESNRFDLVSAFEVIEHLQTPSFLTSEINRVLKMGGVALVTTPVLWFESSLWRLLRIQNNSLHINVHSASFWIRAFKAKGLTYLGDLDQELIVPRNRHLPRDQVTQHWAIRLLRTKLGSPGNWLGIQLANSSAKAFVFGKKCPTDTVTHKNNSNYLGKIDEAC